MKTNRMKPISKSREEGAVLIISLILLLAITVVGLSSIRTTSSQAQMVMGQQGLNRTFQAAESAIEEKLDDINYLNSAYLASVTAGEPVWPTADVQEALESNDYVASTTEARFIDTAVPQGDYAGSLRLGSSGYALYTYEMRGSASAENTGVSNTNVQGAYVLGVKVE